MTAKEKQTLFIKTYLKTTLKTFGYQTSGQTWWKDKGDFYNVINLQNYSWNSKDSVDFRFNIGIALKATLKVSTPATPYFIADPPDVPLQQKAGYEKKTKAVGNVCQG